MNHRFASVICVPRPFNMRYSSVVTVTCLEVDCSTAQIDGYTQDTYRMLDAGEPDKQHTNGQVTFIHRTSLSGGVRPKFLNIKTCQRIRPDKTDITCHGTHSPHEKLTRNACERTRTDRELYCPLALSGKVNSHLSVKVFIYLKFVQPLVCKSVYCTTHRCAR